jgi:tellurite resistance protein
MPQDPDDKRPHEEEYFRRRDQELIDTLRQNAAKKAERSKLAQEAGVAEDDAVLQDLEALGWSGDALKLLHLYPLVQVAWADGKVEAKERELILEAARAQGVVSGSAYDRLLDALNNRPSDERFARALRVAGALLDAMPEEKRTAGARSLVSLAGDIASATGGLFGFGTKVSAVEAKTLARIAGELEKNHAEAAKAVVEKG